MRLRLCRCHSPLLRGHFVSFLVQAIVAGYFAHAARRDPQEGYKTLVEGQTVYIHPSSALFQKNPEWVIYHDLVLTSKEYMRGTCAACMDTSCACNFCRVAEYSADRA